MISQIEVTYRIPISNTSGELHLKARSERNDIENYVAGGHSDEFTTRTGNF